jgi:hypothetical protein
MKTFSFVTLIVALLAWSSAAQAEVIINVYQSGSDVIASGSGTLDTTNLSIISFGINTPYVAGIAASIREGQSGSDYEVFSAVSGPSSFGSGYPFNPDSFSGDVFGVDGANHTLYTPVAYTSGASLSSIDTFNNTTLADLGLTTGTYTYTWGADAHADSLVLNIGSSPSAAVPEPSSLAMCGLASLIGSAYAWRRRQRAA